MFTIMGCDGMLVFTIMGYDGMLLFTIMGCDGMLLFTIMGFPHLLISRQYSRVSTFALVPNSHIQSLVNNANMQQSYQSQCLFCGVMAICVHSCCFKIKCYVVSRSAFSFSAFPTIALGFIILLLLCSQLYLWASPFFFFFCVPSHISAAHHSSSFASQLYLWGPPFFFFFCIPSYSSGVHHSSFAFPAIALGFAIGGEIFA